MVISPKLVAFRTMTRIEYHIASSVVEACLISANFSGFWQHPILKWKTETEMRITKKVSLVVCILYSSSFWLEVLAVSNNPRIRISKDCKTVNQESFANYHLYLLWGHSITTWTRWGGEGRGSKMSVFVHAQGIKTIHAGWGRVGSKNGKILST